MSRNISLRTVEYNGAKIEYELERKAVKNLNMRIRRDGSIYVSVSRAVSAQRVDDCSAADRAAFPSHVYP